ncbi:MAG TPA: branched-chain amino acid ABC transporter permease [Mycobacteriales bacterium]|nr:branched-chain amino acid ABC transporter permease [Mycobacteriales bacterium]
MTALQNTTDAVAAEPHEDRAFRPSVPGLALRGLVYFGIAYVVLVLLTANADRAGKAADAVIYAMVGLSLNIIIGYTGQLSLGHQGFFGAGAFAAAYSLTVHEVPFVLSLLIAMAVTSLFALVLGLVALRITGLYLALITLVFGLTLEVSLFEVEEFTNAGAGQPAFRPDFLVEPFRGVENVRFYYFCLALLAVVVYVDWRLTRTKAGRALLALRENERVAAAFGINVVAFKLFAFVLAGAIAGLAGALFGYRYENVTGADFDFFLALTFVLMVVVGGLNSRVGVILGAVLFSPFGLDNLFKIPRIHDFLAGVSWIGEQRVEFMPRMIGAFLLIQTVVLNPGGIAQQLRPVTRWLAGHRFTLHGDKDSGPGVVEGSSARA